MTFPSTSGGGGGGDASAANQVTGNNSLASILAKLSADPATQTTLAAILAKLIAAPATEAKQTTLLSVLPAALTGGGNLKTAIQEAIPTGTNLMGKVGIDQTTPGTTNAVTALESSVVLPLTLSLDTSAYADDDVLAATQELAGAVRVNAGTARVENLMVIDKDDQKQPMKIIFLKTNVSLGTENAAVSISDADAAEILGIVEIAAADYADLGGVSVAYPKTTPIQPFLVQAGAATTSIYVAVLSKGTGTYSASGIVLNIGLVRM